MTVLSERIAAYAIENSERIAIQGLDRSHTSPGAVRSSNRQARPFTNNRGGALAAGRAPAALNKRLDRTKSEELPRIQDKKTSNLSQSLNDGGDEVKRLFQAARRINLSQSLSGGEELQRRMAMQAKKKAETRKSFNDSCNTFNDSCATFDSDKACVDNSRLRKSLSHWQAELQGTDRCRRMRPGSIEPIREDVASSWSSPSREAGQSLSPRRVSEPTEKPTRGGIEDELTTFCTSSARKRRGTDPAIKRGTDLTIDMSDRTLGTDDEAELCEAACIGALQAAVSAGNALGECEECSVVKVSKRRTVKRKVRRFMRRLLR